MTRPIGRHAWPCRGVEEIAIFGADTWHLRCLFGSLLVQPDSCVIGRGDQSRKRASVGIQLTRIYVNLSRSWSEVSILPFQRISCLITIVWEIFFWIFTSNKIYNGTVKYLKPCKTFIDGAWYSKEAMGEEGPRSVQQQFERVKCGSIDGFDRKHIQGGGKSYRGGCFPPE